VRTGIGLGVDFGLTSSCYDPGDRGAPCGACDACRLRAKGFDGAGVADPVAAPRES
jgi:7-cyano-7-deazaguanine synthase